MDRRNRDSGKTNSICQCFLTERSRREARVLKEEVERIKDSKTQGGSEWKE